MWRPRWRACSAEWVLDDHVRRTTARVARLAYSAHAMCAARASRRDRHRSDAWSMPTPLHGRCSYMHTVIRIKMPWRMASLYGWPSDQAEGIPVSSMRHAQVLADALGSLLMRRRTVHEGVAPNSCDAQRSQVMHSFGAGIVPHEPKGYSGGGQYGCLASRGPHSRVARRWAGYETCRDGSSVLATAQGSPGTRRDPSSPGSRYPRPGRSPSASSARNCCSFGKDEVHAYADD